MRHGSDGNGNGHGNGHTPRNGNGTRNGNDVVVRPARAEDGARLWDFVNEVGELDLNSPYAYLMMGHYFSDTCLVAEDEEHLLGFVLGFQPPTQEDRVFVWQVGVSPRARGRGLGKRLLCELVQRQADDPLRYLEASITADNRASQALFRSFAEEADAPCEVSTLFPKHLFPVRHPAEQLYTIGPFEPATVPSLEGASR